jgi:hypothetical protein
MNAALMACIAQGPVLDRPLHKHSFFRVGAGLRPALAQSIRLVRGARHA